MARVGSRLPGGILRYSLHIGRFQAGRRVGGRRGIIDMGKKSHIGDGFNLELDGRILRVEVLALASNLGVCLSRRFEGEP
jgi:hypothetical protein